MVNTNELQYADAHCHLCPPWFKKNEIQSVVQRANDAKVKYIVNSAVLPKNYSFALETSEYNNIFLSLHPGFLYIKHHCCIP